MTNMFTAKRVMVPGILDDTALQEQLGLLKKQQTDTAKVAPPPSSAVEKAGEISRDFLQLPQSALNIPKRPTVPGLTLSPEQQATAQEEQVQSRGGAIADAISTVAPYTPIGALFGAMSEAGQLTAEEQNVETLQRAEDARQSEQAVQNKAEMRAKLRGMPDEQAAALGLPIAPGGTDLAASGQEMLNDISAVQQSVEKRQTAEAAVRGEAPKVTQKWWLNAAQTAAKSAAQMGTSALKAGPIVWEGIRDFYNVDQLTGGGRSNMRAWVDTVDASLDKLLPGDKARSKDFVTQLSSGAGSFAGFMVAGYVGSAAGLPAGFTTGVLGAATEGTQMFEEAEQFNATGLQKYLAFIEGAALGLTEAVPIDRMFMRADADTGGLLRRMLNNTTATSLEEFTQEFGQAIGEDMIAKYLSGFDPDRELDAREWLKAGAIGALTGAAGGGATTLLSEAGSGANPAAVDEQETMARAAIDALDVQIGKIEGVSEVADNVVPAEGVDLETQAAEAVDAAVAPQAYLIAPRSEWQGEANFEQNDGALVEMTPDEYLAAARPLTMDAESRENVDILKEHIQRGGTLDPLKFFNGGKEDGRHRAIAAKELGIASVPVVVFGDQKERFKSAMSTDAEAALTPETKALFDQILGDAKQRKETAATLAAGGGSVRLSSTDGRYALAGPDMSKPGTFRLTRFDARGPVGHTEHSTLEEAVLEGLRARYVPPEFEATVGQAQGTSSTRQPMTGEETRPVQGVPTTPANAAEGSDASLAKISKGFMNLLNLTVRQGRFTLKGSRIMGQYTSRQRTIRLRTWGDLSTLVHEGGHALHDMMAGPLASFVSQNEAALMAVADKLYGNGVTDTAALNRAQHVREGFAEFFRIYTLSRGYAERNYPDLVDQFRTLLERDNPSLERGLQLVGAQFSAFLQAPSTQVLRNIVQPGQNAVGLNAAVQELREVGFRSWMSEYARIGMETSVNRFAGVNRLVSDMLNIGQREKGSAIDLKRADDPRTLIRLAPNFGARVMVQLTDGIYGYRSTQPSSASLRDAILISQGLDPKQSPKRFDEQRLHDFDTYLVALRALDEYRRLAEGKIERPPVGVSLGDVNVAAKELRAKYGESFHDAAMMVHEFGMAMWKKQYDAGLMSRETYADGLDRQFYVPLQRDMSDKQGQFDSNALVGAKSLVKRFKGSDRDIVSPTSVLMHKLFSLEKAIVENDVKKSLAQLADRVGTAGALVERIPSTQLVGTTANVRDVARALAKDDTLTEMDAQDLMTILSGSIKEGNTITLFRSKDASEAGENILFFFEDGKVKAIQLADGALGADIVNTISGLGRENMHWSLELLAGTSQIYRTAITAWPDFLIVNFVRDQMSAWILNNVGFKPFVSGFGGMLDEVRQRQWAKMYNAALGIMGGMNVASLHQARMERDLNSLRGKGYIAKAFNEPGVMGKVAGFAHVMELSETGTRLGLFKKAFERGKKDGLDDYEASVEAAYIATDYIDFGLNGNRMMLMRRTIPFLNAQIQGFYKMLRTLGGDEVRQRKGLKFVLGAYMKSTKGMELSRVEKQAIQTGRAAWVKMASLGLLSALLHFIFEDDEDYQEVGEYMRTTNWVIPIGDGRIVSIPKPFELALIANAVERGLESASGDPSAKGKFIRGAALSLTPPTSPPFIQSLIEYAANKDFFTGREIVPSYMQALSPELQYDNYTSALAKNIGEITGWSPMVVEHFISGLGASAYRDMTTMTNALDPSRPTMDATDAPLARRFVRDVRRGSQTSADFWAQASTLNGKLRTAEVTYKTFLEQGNTPAANRFLSSLSDDEQAYALLATHFKANAKRLNPFYRGRQISTIVSGMRREMISSLGLENTDKYVDDKTIRMTAGRKAQVDELLSELARREMRNTLISTGAPGWRGKKPMDVETTLAMIEQVSPRAHEELIRRLDKAKVYDGAAVLEGWPEVRNRLLQDREDAFLDDMVSNAKAYR